jgi:hypothetical protein
VVKLPDLQRDQPHQLQAIGMGGVDRKRLFAAKLRIELAPGLEVGEAGRVERSSGGGRRVFTKTLASGRFGVATVHQACFNLDRTATV